MDALAGEGVEIDGHGGGERLSLAGLHLGDLTLVQHNGAHDLHVEGSHAEHAPGDFPHDREGLVQYIVDRLPTFEPLPKLVGLRPKLLVESSSISGFQSRDGIDALLERLNLAAFAHAKILVSKLPRLLFLARAPDRVFRPPSPVRLLPRGLYHP